MSLIIADEFNKKSISELVKLSVQNKKSPLERSDIMRLIEFGRTVHAEMAAIVTAAKNGVPIKDTTLYTTTFPCHECAKHIIAVGIKRVVYVEPYPKSAALTLFREELSLENTDCKDTNHPKIQVSPFVGISPLRFLEFFQRNRINIHPDSWVDSDASFRSSGFAPETVKKNETAWLGTFNETIKEKNLNFSDKQEN